MLKSWMAHELNYADAGEDTIHDYAYVIGGTPRNPSLFWLLGF